MCALLLAQGSRQFQYLSGQLARECFSARTSADGRFRLVDFPTNATAFGLAADAVPSGKPVLFCLLDVEQRPSRRMARLLAEQHEALRQKGLTVLAAQGIITEPEAIQEWQQASPVPFPFGRVSEKSEKTKWAADQESLPWLILTDAAGRVVAEGFALDELDAKLKPAGK